MPTIKSTAKENKNSNKENKNKEQERNNDNKAPEIPLEPIPDVIIDRKQSLTMNDINGRSDDENELEGVMPNPKFDIDNSEFREEQRKSRERESIRESTGTRKKIEKAHDERNKEDIERQRKERENMKETKRKEWNDVKEIPETREKEVEKESEVEVQSVDENEHTLILEDTFELCSPNKKTTRLISSDKYDQSLDNLLTYGLRMTPDRIILGEMRSSEVSSFVLAMISGYIVSKIFPPNYNGSEIKTL